MNGAATPKAKKSLIQRVGAWVLGLIAYAVGRSLGWIFLWPFLGAAVSGITATRFLRPRLQPLVPAVAVQGGQLIWLLVGMSVLLIYPKDIARIGANYYPYGQVLDLFAQAALYFLGTTPANRWRRAHRQHLPRTCACESRSELYEYELEHCGRAGSRRSHAAQRLDHRPSVRRGLSDTACRIGHGCHINGQPAGGATKQWRVNLAVGGPI